MGLFETAVLAVSLIVLMLIMGFVLKMKGLPEYADDQLCLRHTENVTLNCGNQKDVLLDFLQTQISESFHRIDKDVQARHDRRRVTLKYYVRNRYWEMKPAARFTGESELSKEYNVTKSGMVPLVNWKTGHKQIHWGGFKRYGIYYKHGRIVVPVSGVYLLYSYLDLFHPFKDFSDEVIIVPKNKTFKHSMYKYNYYTEEETELLTALTPQKTARSNHFNRFSSFVSGIVNLTAGEEISLKVNDVELLEYPENNCMGVNLL